MTLLSGTQLQATSKETKTKFDTDFDIPLTEEAVKKRKEDKRLHEVIVSIESPGEGSVEGPDESLSGIGPPAEGPGDCPDKEPAEGLATASLAQGPAVEDPAAEGPAAEGPAAKNPYGGLGNITQSFLTYKLQEPL